MTLAPSVVKLFRLQKLEQNGKRLKAGKRWTERDLVFSDETGDFLSRRVIHRCFKELVKEIGTPSTRFHDLRHSCATIMLYLGYTLKDIQTWLGHSNYNFTADTYIHSGAGVHEQMAQSLSDRLVEVLPQNMLAGPNFS